MKNTKKMTYYVNGLNDIIRMVVARHRENVPRPDLTFEGFSRISRFEDDAHRARMEHISKEMAIPETKPRRILRPTSTYLIQDTPRTERTPNLMLSPTPRTTVHLMDEKSQEPVTTSKVEEDETLDQDQVQ